MGGLTLIFLPSLKIEKPPSLGRHRERLVDNLYFENKKKIKKKRAPKKKPPAAHSGKE